eukprot:356587-Chlamydomonas_euryale.AAC.3
MVHGAPTKRQPTSSRPHALDGVFFMVDLAPAWDGVFFMVDLAPARLTRLGHIARMPDESVVEQLSLLKGWGD